MFNYFSNIRIVLVNTSHPGNIGAAARAMKTMGLEQLYLVEPKIFPNEIATALASNADDVLAKAAVVETLTDAIKDCRLVLGTSARTRELTWPTLEARAASQQIIAEANLGTVAIVFGREDTGLTNEELKLCHYQIQIPSNPVYSSLNLAAAVQIICYEIRMSVLNKLEAAPLPVFDEVVTAAELEGFYAHLEKVLKDIDFIKLSSGPVINRLRRLYNRTRIEKKELRILRGMLTAMETVMKKKENK